MIGCRRREGKLEVTGEIQRRRDGEVCQRPGADVHAGVTGAGRETVDPVGQRRADRNAGRHQRQRFRAVGVGNRRRDVERQRRVPSVLVSVNSWACDAACTGVRPRHQEAIGSRSRDRRVHLAARCQRIDQDLAADLAPVALNR